LPYLYIIEDLSTTYEYLVALKQSLAPTEIERGQDVLREYKAVRPFNSKRMNLDA
jgi:hypothetical protein